MGAAEEVDVESLPEAPLVQQKEAELSPSEDATPQFKYTAEANDPKVRVKRALENPNKKKSCSLYIQTDPLFWAHVKEQVRFKVQLTYLCASVKDLFLYCIFVV